MFWPFRSSIVDDDMADWQLDCFAWMLENFGGYERFRQTPVILPTADFFPDQGLEGHAFALDVFKRVQRLADMENWPCELVSQTSGEPQDTDDAPEANDDGALLGTFQIARNRAEPTLVTYNPALLSDPVGLVATFAHELAHYLIIGGAWTEPPGGWDNDEFVTDMTGVFLGFGVFLVNSSFEFGPGQHADVLGPSTSRQGYLNETSLLFAMAIQTLLQDGDEHVVRAHLKPHLDKLFVKAMNEAEKRRDEIIALRDIEGLPPLHSGGRLVPPPVLPRIQEAMAAADFDMGLQNQVGWLLRSLAASKPGGRFLELGTGLGAGSAWIADGMDATSALVTVELSSDLSRQAEDLLGSDGQIEFRAQDAVAFLTTYDGPPFDLIFADAMPGKFDHLEDALALLAPGGIYVGDDLRPQANWPENHQPNVDAFIEKLTDDPRFETTVLDWSSGVLMAVRKPD